MIGRIVLGPGIVSSRVLAPFVLAPCVLAALTSIPAVSLAQDVPGIEICTAEKAMERRTSCLQSNINFLQMTINKLSADHQQKIVNDLQASPKKPAEDPNKAQPAAKATPQARDPPQAKDAPASKEGAK